MDPTSKLTKCAILNCAARLPPLMRENFIRFYNKRLEIRRKCLHEDPQQFVLMDSKFGLNEKTLCGVTEGMFDYLQNSELLSFQLPPFFLSNCNDVNSRMRYILVNWMVQVHQSYRLSHDTLFLSIRILDRFVHVSFSCSASYLCILF